MYDVTVPHFFNEAKSCKQQIAQHLNDFHRFDQIILPNNMLHLSTQFKSTASNGTILQHKNKLTKHVRHVKIIPYANSELSLTYSQSDLEIYKPESRNR